MNHEDLYMGNGYVNIEAILKAGMTFNFIVGGRGTGKTFNALDWAIRSGRMFVFMRRNQTQLDNVTSKELSPFRPINELRKICIEPESIAKGVYTFNHVSYGEDLTRTVGERVGYGVALSTISNLRGFNLSDASLLIFDEFIPETHERPIKHESDAFFNAYETINRNRELSGQAAMQVVCLANANSFANPLFLALNLVHTVENMLKSGKEIYINPQRSVGVFLLQDSPISKAKADTVLYRLTHGSAFEQMAVSNAFAGFDDPSIKPQPLHLYQPVLSVGELTLYKHKADKRLYCTHHKSGSPYTYSADGVDLRRFRANEKRVQIYAMANRILYETHLDKALLFKYLDLV